MLDVLGLWPAKYLGLAALFIMLERRLEPFGERRLSRALAEPGKGAADGLGAAAAMLDAIAGRRIVSLRYLGTIAMLTLAAYPLVFLYALSWSDAMRALMLRPADDGAARASAILQLGWFWLFFGPPAMLFSLGAGQALAEVIGQRMGAGTRREIAFAGLGVLATTAVLWLMYFATVVIAGPGDGAGVLVDLDRATISLAYALAFNLTAGIYVYAGFLPLFLALAAMLAARFNRHGPPTPTIWRPFIPVLGLTAVIDILNGLGF